MKRSLRPSQSIVQAQIQQQRLSPQQIQYIKLLQLPTLQLEQRVKQEIEENPVLEIDEQEYGEGSDELYDTPEEGSNEYDRTGDDSEPFDSPEDAAGPVEESLAGATDSAEGVQRGESDASEATDDAPEAASTDQNHEIDWDTFFPQNEEEYVPAYRASDEDWRELPKPYKSGFTEQMEQQIALLPLDEAERTLAVQIIGSVDADGYLRRDLSAIVDAVAFNEGVLLTDKAAEKVLRYVQRLDPPGIGARDLQECLLVQLETLHSGSAYYKHAREILANAWEEFEKKHFDKIRRRFNLTDEQLRSAHQLIMQLDPKPGESDSYLNAEEFIIPDFEVYYDDSVEEEDSQSAGGFVITLNRRNMPPVRISRYYRQMWEAMNSPDASKSKAHRPEEKQARQFIKDKMESARWFIETIQQRQNTLLMVMKTIVALQDTFFRTGRALRPMILKDVAERIEMDISTVSRVVNGKYVQTAFGVFELKYFFSEGVASETGESISNREIKNTLQSLIEAEDKQKPLSDLALTRALAEKGFPVARRTVTKYREQLGLPVARMRKDVS